jgi:outer membrane protein assembly factor BamB
MKKIKPIITIFLVVMALGCVNAQEALWQLDFDKEVEWTKITDAGILLAGTTDMMLMGIDSRNGEILWESDIMKGARGIKGADGKKQDESALFDQYVQVMESEEYPEMSDYIAIKYTDYVAFKNFAIINMLTGEEILSPRKADMPISKFMGKEMPTFNYNGSGYFPEIKGAIISASWIDYNTKGNPELMVTKMVDLPSGKIRWETDQIAVDARPIVTADGNILMGGKSKIAKLNASNGNIMWEFNTTEKNQTFESIDVSLDLLSGYFFEKVKNNGQLTALDLSTGEREWTKELKLKEIPTMFALRDGVVVMDEKWLTYYDINNGEIKWQSKKVSGIVIDLGSFGIAVVAKEKQLKLLNRETGEDIWDEKVSGINIDQVCGKGIMYSDSKGRLGLITYDGEKVWDKKGMLEVPSVRYKPSYDKELMYIEGTLYEVDLQKGDYKILMDNIDKKFEENEVPDKIESYEGGYLLSSATNLMMLETDGSLRFHKYWDAPELSLAAKIALRTAQVLSYAMAAANSAAASYSNTYGYNWESKFYQDQADRYGAAGDAAGDEARKRFTATKSKGDLQIVLAIVGEGGQGKASGFVKVDKRTGEDLATIQIGDKEPVYDYDPISGQVFVKSDKKQIISYLF